jgi:dihydrolipoamide dehydrogenase
MFSIYPSWHTENRHGFAARTPRVPQEQRWPAASAGKRVVSLAGGDEIRCDELVVASGRAPRVSGLSLENAGIEPGSAGIEVDDRCRAAEGVWAVGDVTGAMPFTHVAMYQGRIVVADILGEKPRADYTGVPRVVFCDPEVAAVGMTREQACDAGIPTAEAGIELQASITRPRTYEREPRGELSILVNRELRTLAGAWAVGPLASEWIHYAALGIKAQVPISVLKDTVAQFPTFTEAYLKALEKLDA